MTTGTEVSPLVLIVSGPSGSGKSTLVQRLLELPRTMPSVSRTTRPRRTTERDRKSTRLNSSHGYISYAVFCLKKKKSASMRYIYRHPTIRSLAAALADLAPSSPRPAVPTAVPHPTPTSTPEYILLALPQVLLS